MPIIGVTTPPADWVSEESTSSDIDEIINFLSDQGTFNFPTLSTGVFAAAAAENPEFRLTGYQNVWLRDNIHVAHALWVVGHKAIAVGAVSAFVRFYSRYRQKFVDIIDGIVDPEEAQSRPHIRFDGESLTENEETWAHAQNDALGYFLWLLCKLLRSQDLPASSETSDLLTLLVRYFHKIEYWHDVDSGHWEETRKIEASSIGPVVAGLRELQAGILDGKILVADLDSHELQTCLRQGESALEEILPAECIQPDPSQYRLYDSALLFLCYPLEILDDEMTVQIAENVRQHLQEPIGIKRYLGDSYWCANYRSLLSAEKRTTDFSEDLSGRDALLQQGQEAQWCLFDPILSIIYGRRFLALGMDADRQLQIQHLQRSLAQLTTAESRFPTYRCPESYFLENGEWIPNDICPLLWTQANLRLALHWMKKTVATKV